MRGAIALSTDNWSTSSKKVSWETVQKLCQVRLFAAEDAPLLSGTTLQELYQEKETKFLHAVEPVSESDLPPGFVSFAVKQTGIGANTNVGMDSQVQWREPEKFLYKVAWLVAAGGESIEVFAESRRELGVQEAVYSQSNAIPASPVEPQETPAELNDHVVPEIPVFSVEDEDELEEGFSPGTSGFESSNMGLKLGDVASPSQSPSKGFEKIEPGEKPGGSSSTTWQEGQADQGPSTSCLSDADPNVAAAAAAAYAVLKAKERGALVDHDLLIKILTNPILIKALLASNRNLDSQPRDLLRAISEGADKVCNYTGDNELAGRGKSNSMGSNMFALPVKLGGKATVSAVEDAQGVHESTNSQAWNPFNHRGTARPIVGSRAEDQFYGRAEMPGQTTGTSGIGVPLSQMIPNRQNVLKDLIQKHGIEKSRNEGLPRGLTEMEFIGNTERLRAPILGTFSQLGAGNKQVAASSHGRNDGFSHGRPGGEMVHSRFQKPCLYFNTPKGCRRGTSCFYLHDSAPEQSYNEQSRTDFFQFQQAKRPKFGVPEKD
eukprot:c40231_g1_i1 orf=399-2039(+)